MATSVEIDFDLLVDLDMPVACEGFDCDNEATLVRRHDGCSLLNCTGCRDIVRWQFLTADEDEFFWCPGCEESMPLQHCLDEVRWVPL